MENFEYVNCFTVQAIGQEVRIRFSKNVNMELPVDDNTSIDIVMTENCAICLKNAINTVLENKNVQKH